MALYGASNFPIRPLSAEVKTLSAFGFDYLELCLDPPYGLPEKIDTAELKRISAGEGLPVLVGHLPAFVWLADAYQSIREASLLEVRKALDVLVELEVEKAVLHPAYITGLLRITPEVGRHLARGSLVRILADAGERGITLCLENMFPRAGHMYRPEEFVEILKEFPELAVTLDLGHGNIKAPAGRVVALVEAAGDRIKHVHLSDNSGGDDEHLPLGAGRVDIIGGLSALKRMDYDGTFTLEVFSPDRDYLVMSLNKIREIWNGL